MVTDGVDASKMVMMRRMVIVVICDVTRMKNLGWTKYHASYLHAGISLGYYRGVWEFFDGSVPAVCVCDTLLHKRVRNASIQRIHIFQRV